MTAGDLPFLRAREIAGLRDVLHSIAEATGEFEKEGACYVSFQILRHRAFLPEARTF